MALPCKVAHFAAVVAAFAEFISPLLAIFATLIVVLELYFDGFSVDIALVISESEERLTLLRIRVRLCGLSCRRRQSSIKSYGSFWLQR